MDDTLDDMLRLRLDIAYDGTDFTADDVAYSMNRVINEEDPSYATGHAYMLSNFNEFEVVDADARRIKRLRVRLKAGADAPAAAAE